MSKSFIWVLAGSVLLVFFGVVLLTRNEVVPEKNTLLTSEPPMVTVVPTSMAIVDFTELKITDIEVGSGAEVKTGDTVVIHYSGTLVDGTKFDSSYDRGQPFETQIGVGRVIAGWDQGVVGMKVGGKRKLEVPSALAYGQRGAPPTIMPNTPLLFELELLGIK